MFHVELNRGAGFSDAEWAKQVEAAYWWQKCWNDPSFQGSIVNYKQTRTTCMGSLWWKKCTTAPGPEGFTYTNLLAPQILAIMLKGAETLKPDADGTANVEIVVGNQGGVLGWTYPNVLTEWVSRWFIDGASIADLAGNRAHEYMHKLGFDHPFRATWDRPFSVPYAVGELTRAWVEANYVAGEYRAA